MNCQQPGCAGQVVDGYCDTCGMAPARSTPAPSAEMQQPTRAPVTSTGLGSATVAAVSSARPSSTTRTRPSMRRRLGAGLVEIPPITAVDPADAVMADPQVPESRRFCAVDGEPVGRGRDGVPGRSSGFCRKCGTPFSFEPKLLPGMLVAGQYEVVGCLAHGGMGWVYLARDRNVSDRWVVLKGLLNTGDSDATAAALAERRFLAEVEHPNIVKIFNFVQHESSGYIVMEYVGGQSLKQILTARREANGGAADPLPPAQAIAYMLEILPALGHLHEQGLVFCDFKVDNVIQSQHSLKLIDLGGVYRVDEPGSAIFGTVGYQAPEIAAAGPSVPSDLFTVARTLAVLCIDFKGYQSTYRYTLPERDTVPLFQRHDSLYRFLLKATATDPDDRFQSADEMAGQLYGVLREVVAAETDQPVPAPSTRFTAPLRARPDRADWRVLPRPQADREDESAGYLAALTVTDPRQMLVQLEAAPVRTVEVELRIAAAMIDAGDFAGAEATLDAIEAQSGREWRVAWYRGLADLARDRAAAAAAAFDHVCHDVPGELAPKLALGMAFEAAECSDLAAPWYEVVARTDNTVTSAAFGLARCRLAAGDRAGAVAAYDRIPDSSSGYIDAQMARIQCLNVGNGAGEPAAEELLTAGAILEGLPLEDEQHERLAAQLLEAALRVTVASGGAGDAAPRLLGHRMIETDLRFGLERSYRALARRAFTRAERIRLVDAANHVRPRTWT